jgi:hypothetical protein
MASEERRRERGMGTERPNSSGLGVERSCAGEILETTRGGMSLALLQTCFETVAVGWSSG